MKLRPGALAPKYMSAGAAGLDLASAADASIEIAPGARAAVPTGLAFEIPPGFEGQVRPRSGLARKFGIGLPNAPGTIDSDYRGEVAVLLVNLGLGAVHREAGGSRRPVGDRAGRHRGAEEVAAAVGHGAGRRWVRAHRLAASCPIRPTSGCRRSSVDVEVWPAETATRGAGRGRDEILCGTSRS